MLKAKVVAAAIPRDWGREKDEDEIEWIWRSLRLTTRMIKPRKDKGLGGVI